MAKGFLKAFLTSGSEAIPVHNAKVTISEPNGKILKELYTDISGSIEIVELETCEKSRSLSSENKLPACHVYNVNIEKEGFIPAEFRGVQIFEGITTTQFIDMEPIPKDKKYSNMKNIYYSSSQFSRDRNEGICTNAEKTFANTSGEANTDTQTAPSEGPPISVREVYIPETITVHLGPPDEPAPNVTVSFLDYIKNVASSEIYPTWPREALLANIYAIISYTLNRIYTEWYRSRGYDFDITNSTAYDHTYIHGRPVFEPISNIVDEVFNEYIKREGFTEPYFAEYCSGTDVTCPGLSQWGTVDLANLGMSPLEILRFYYPSDIHLVRTNDIRGVTETYPGIPLMRGSSGNNVARIQSQLNRIALNFPAIPRLPLVTGVFGPPTEEAVKAFQQAFSLSPDGIVGPATWYKINNIYNAVTKLAELVSEGDRPVTFVPPDVVLREWSTGPEVLTLQFALYLISDFYNAVIAPVRDGVFGPGTTNSVKSFQERFGLTPDGVVGSETWNAIFDVITGIRESASSELGQSASSQPKSQNSFVPTQAYPGILLRKGVRGPTVRRIQSYLNTISTVIPSIPLLNIDGIFGLAMKRAVLAFQNHYRLKPDGIVGPDTWDTIVKIYRSIVGDNQISASGKTPHSKQAVRIQPQSPSKPKHTKSAQNQSPSVKVSHLQEYIPYPGLQKLGSRGEMVRIIQQHLNSLRTIYPDIPQLAEDGIFGPMTEGGTIAFQLQFGINPNGEVNNETWDKLMQAYQIIIDTLPPPFTPLPHVNPPYPGYVIQEGSRGVDVRIIQEILNTLRTVFANWSAIEVDGIFGPKTKEALMTYQRDIGFEPNGVVDEKMWVTLVLADQKVREITPPSS